ncbi:DUF5366 family protein [Bacillus massiliglaciei]|uniref:DUF5366 family protein n=1 Tax=Bacillus massiliglaciei TaxID=1816693 RepID=UPI000B0FE018|nr:DUF5366 family protein [Bacillus massiliglaciei]
MKNTYLIGYFPLFSILLFSLSFAIYGESQVLIWFDKLGVYQGMLEFFSETGIKVSLLIVFLLIFFMLFSALKLISDTNIELSLLFFSKESEGKSLTSFRLGAVIYVLGGAVCLMSAASIIGMVCIFLLTNLIAFFYFVYKVSGSLGLAGIVGVIFFHIFLWSAFLSIVTYTAVKLYNGLMASLPI